MNLSSELTKQVNAHIDEVRNYLGNLPADERQEILQSIESHIYDALESRSDDDPSSALLDAVIAEMDPPDSYGSDSVETTTPSKPRLLKSIGRGYVLKFTLITIIAIVYLVLDYMKEVEPAKTAEIEVSIIGNWTSVDFVEQPEKFDPETKNWRGDLHLKELTFLPDGKTDRAFWTWKNNLLHHSGDNTDAKFLIKKISGTEYLFLEWMSGDVIHKGLPPKYYVLKKSDLNYK